MMAARFFQTSPVRLAAWFAVSFLVFFALRWQPQAWLEGWLAGQIARQAAQAGVQVSWRDMRLSGAGLALEGLRIGRGGREVLLARLDVSPAWRMLAHGRLAAHLHVHGWNGMDGEAEATLWREGGRIRLEDASLRLKASALDALIAARAPMPVSLDGMIETRGALWLDAASGRPLAGRLEARWHEAAVRISGAMVARGAYRLAASGEKGIWQWTVKGEGAPELEAQGALNAAVGPPVAWRLSGRAHLRGGEGMLGALIGGGAKIEISGTLARPVARLAGM